MPDSCILQKRQLDPNLALHLRTLRPDLTPLEAALLTSRGAVSVEPSVPTLLQRPLKDLAAGARRIAQAIEHKQRIVVVADYDCDGATSCAVAVAGLSALGGTVGYVVPDRMVHGYGISASVVDLARERYPDARVLLTVDNGILGHAGIDYAGQHGLDVVVTDHHLPGASLPNAVAVIDPARDDCPGQLPKLAGVGVALWLVVATKKVLTDQGVPSPALTFLLPYVAVGTVADMVGFDEANRALVSVGLDLMRKGAVPPGLKALIKEAGSVGAYLTTQDIGFGLGPRINAAGRLETMDAGIELLLAQDAARAADLAKMLTKTNEERKKLQRDATEDVSVSLEFGFRPEMRSIVRGSTEWHPGIVGLVASRLKENFFRPSFVFALKEGGAPKGSGRSVPGFHLKDALEEVARRAPGVLLKFGGHAMAAGATLRDSEALYEFSEVFEEVAAERITAAMLEQTLLSDGPMPALELHDAARILRHPWGQGFEAPAFDSDALIETVKPLGKDGKHWKIEARIDGSAHKTFVVLFNHPEPVVGQTVRLYLQPSLNTWKEKTSLQWLGRVLH